MSTQTDKEMELRDQYGWVGFNAYCAFCERITETDDVASFCNRSTEEIANDLKVSPGIFHEVFYWAVINDLLTIDLYGVKHAPGTVIVNMGAH